MLPTPDELLTKARQQPAKFDLIDYWQSVVTLRQRGWSWRQISEWLRQYGMTVDHSAIFRFVKNNLAVHLACLPTKEFESEAHDILSERSAAIENSDEFCSAIAETNCCGFEIEEYEIGALSINEDGVSFTASWHATGEQLDDRPYAGRSISGSMTVTIDLDGDVSFDEISACRDEEEFDPIDY